MKVKTPRRFLLRALSLLLLCTACALDYFFRFTPEALCADLYAALGILLLHPLDSESAGAALAAGCIFASLDVALHFIAGFPVSLDVTVTLFLTVRLAVLILRKYSRVKELFRSDALWKGMEESSTLFYTLLVVGTQAAAVSPWIRLALSAVWYPLLLRRSRRNSPMLAGAKREEEIREYIRNGLRPVLHVPSDDADRMNAIYEKAVTYMQQRRPFLDDEFNLADLARAVLSNKSYLSRSINVNSGRNFRQFVNYYRVNYSIELMKKDPRLRVMELAMMSGFHSVVTYNMAFKLQMNTTPSEYCRQMEFMRD